MRPKLTTAPAGMPAMSAFLDAYLEAPAGTDARLRLAFAATAEGIDPAPLIVADCAGVTVALSIEEAAGLAFIAQVAAKAVRSKASPDVLRLLADQLDGAIDEIAAGLTSGKPN